MTSDVVLATCAQLPAGDVDDADLPVALQRLGITARWQDWADPVADFDAAYVVIRSTWDYPDRREEFLRWARNVDRLANPAEVIGWNTDKVYLRELADAGIPVTPTRWAAPGVDVSLDFDTDFVVKPSVGAGSRLAGRFGAHETDRARAHLEVLHSAGATAMVQPYLHDVDTAGEGALLYFDGEFSHAITKHAMLPPGTVHDILPDALFVRERIESRVPTAAELDAGARAVRYVSDRFGVPLYMRVDLLPSADGPVVVEVELTEPSLFFGFAPGSVDRFAAAIAGRL